MHVAILMRWGVTIFKMPLSTAATVNQFQNPKVSIVKREEGGGEGQEGHLLFLIRMDQSFFFPSLPVLLSPSLALSFFLLPFQVSPFHFFYLSMYLFCPPPWELNGTDEGCHFKMSPWQNKNSHVHVFFQYATSFHFYLHAWEWVVFLLLTSKVPRMPSAGFCCCIDPWAAAVVITPPAHRQSNNSASNTCVFTA